MIRNRCQLCQINVVDSMQNVYYFSLNRNNNNNMQYKK